MMDMSLGPIEFLGEEPAHDVPDSEYGGADGLIQPATPGLLSTDPEGHGDEAFLGTREGAGEMLNMINRRGGWTLTPTEAWTGEADAGTMGPSGEVLDPVTGRMVPVDGNKSGGAGSGELSDLKPQ